MKINFDDLNLRAGNKTNMGLCIDEILWKDLKPFLREQKIKLSTLVNELLWSWFKYAKEK